MTEQVTSYREAAIADGWQPKAGSDYRLLRDGFVMDARESCAWDCIHIWGPDGLAIKVPNSNASFVAKSFGEHMEETVEKAKAEVHGYMTHVIQRAGLEAITGGQLPLQIERKA
jgi:hypothetical protein